MTGELSASSLLLLLTALVVAGFLYALVAVERRVSAATALGIVALLAALFVVREVLPPFILAFALASLLDPLLDRMVRQGMPRMGAAIVTLLLVLVPLVLLGAVLVPMIVRQGFELADQAPQIEKSLRGIAASLTERFGPLLRQMHLPDTPQALLDRYQAPLTTFATGLLRGIGGGLSGFLARSLWLIIIPIITFYLLLDIDRLRARMLHLVPHVQRPRVVQISRQVGGVFVGYIRGLLIVCTAYAVLVAIALTFWRLPYALVIGLVAGVLYAVPYVGAVGLVGITLLVSAITGHTTGYSVGVVVTVLLLNQVFDQAVTPRIVGDLTGIHPLTSLFALLVGGNVFGLWGMILAVPVAASLKVVLVHFFPALTEPLPTPEPLPEQTLATAAVLAPDPGPPGETLSRLPSQTAHVAGAGAIPAPTSEDPRP